VVNDYSRSPLSIHHLATEDKRLLFHKIYAALAPGGLFVNADQAEGEALYFWQRYIDNRNRIFAERVDAEKPNMGLSAWKGAKVRRGDVTVAKNYLNEEEIHELNRIITMYLDYAETQAERRRPVHMSEWREKMDAFLKFNERDILHDSGRVSMEVAQRLALEEYDKFSTRRLAEEALLPDTDFEPVRKQIEGKRKDHKNPRKDMSRL